jgi:hypothetical protein
MHSRLTHLEQVGGKVGSAFTMAASGSAAQPNGPSRKPGQRVADCLGEAADATAVMFGLSFREPGKAVTFRKMYGWARRLEALLNWRQYFLASMIVITRKDRQLPGWLIRLSPGAGPLAAPVQSSSIGSSVQYDGSVSTSAGSQPSCGRGNLRRCS